MKRFWGMLVAVLAILALSGLVGPASAAPSPRVSERVAISADCTLTLYASWGGVWVGSDDLYVAVQGAGDPVGVYVPVVTTSRGKATVTFSGTPVTTVYAVQVGASIGAAGDQVTKRAPCTNFVYIGSTPG